MKTKPKDAIERCREDYIGTVDWKSVLAFLDSLPDTFDIVSPGKMQVEWPKEAQKQSLEDLANWLLAEEKHDWYCCVAALAAIAPKKRTRMVNLWRVGIEDPIAKPTDWAPRVNELWRKVNASPVEIED